MRFPSVTLRLPGWVGGLILDPDRTYPNAEDRMRLAVELSREGSHRGKGDLSEQRSSTGRRTSSSPPVPRPRCKPRSCPGYSFAHVKMVAIMVTPQLSGDFDLGGRGSHLTSWSPVPSFAPCALGGPLVRCKAPRPRHPRRGRRSGRLRQRTEARRVGAYARRTQHHRRARRAP
jgi:hypothetical protein